MSKNRTWTRIMAFIMAFLMVCLFLVPAEDTRAKDTFIAQFIQTIYNQKNGIGSNEVNCLYQSTSGYIWVGTDGGLYRSDGAEFQSINLWDTDRTDVYSINCIMQDTQGRVWVGTDNYGLFYIEHGEDYHLQDEYYNGIKSIYDICQTEDGTIYVAAAQGLYTCEISDDQVMHLNMHPDAALSGLDIKDIEAKEDSVWLLDSNNKIHIVNSTEIQYTIDTTDMVSDELTCVRRIGNEIYAGSTGREILRFRSRASYSKLTVGVEGVNGMMADSNGYLWVWADNGIGYIDSADSFVKVNDCEIDSYLSDMIQDYEGNYWIASNRLGLLLLSRSKFIDYNMYTGMQETMVNTVYTYQDKKYIGSDAGIIIYDNAGERLNNELTDMLSGISVRHITSDSKGNLWISTYRKYGLVKVEPDGTVTNYGRGFDLPSLSINCTLELSSGMIAVATDDGIAVMDRAGNVKYTYTEEDGILYSNVTCLYQGEDNKLYAGTDGGGIYVIVPGKDAEIENYDMDDGLNSNVVTSIEAGEQGLWIGTDNGLCFYNESFRSISNIEYSNSIYDVLIKDESVWIIGSMGVLCSTEDELLGNQGLSGRYMDASDGLSKTINTMGNCYIDENDLLYVCCDTGICVLDIAHIVYNQVPPKIRVTAVDVDGVTYEFDDLADGLKIKSDVSRITIDFAVFSYSNRGDIQVEYSLKGFDEEPIVISGLDVMEAVYTNLDGGTYEFTISAHNGDGTMCESEVSFTIEKEKSFFENPSARIMLLVVIMVAVAVAIFAILRVRKMLQRNSSALERLSREHEEAIKSSSAKNDYLANMSNEIKTPINAMMVKADELLHVFENDEENQSKIQSIYDIGREIIDKVDDIILLAKIEAGKVVAEESAYSISNMIYELAEKNRGRIGDKPVKFFVELGEILSDNVIGDSKKISDILDRILDNAVKYTKEGSITLSVDCYEYADRPHHDMMNVVFTVSDTGIGIQEDRIDSLFEVYNIVDNAKSGIHAGNGVGLAIAKGYADLIRGEIEVESMYGSGSTFSLSVIQKIADKNASNHVIAKIEGTVSKEIADKLWLPDVNALLVDDDDVSREVSAKVLEQFEMKVDVASSGVGAIDMVMNHAYDVVFMDLSMPIMNGIDAMREIREIEGDAYAYLPIIAMDTNAIEENKERLLEEGFTDSLLKPIERQRIAAILRDCLPESKIREKSSDIEQYIAGSRYGEGLERLKLYVDVGGTIEKIGGSIDVYNKLITIYYNQNSAAIEELYDKLGKDARAFKAKIHAIRTNSASIGANSLSKAASKMEAAINIGNRDYVKDNLEDFTDQLLDVLFAVEEYISFMESVSGFSDEEYAAKKAEERERQEEAGEKLNIMPMDVLETIKYDALEGAYERVEENMQVLLNGKYTGEDKELLDVLNQAVRDRNIPVIDELITTYFDLKV